MNKKVFPLIVILLIIAAFLAGLKLTQKKQPGSGGVSPTPSAGEVQPTEAPKYPATVGNFLVTNNEICKENSKPIIYYFGSSTCPHCVWESPVIKKVMEKFSGLVSFHSNIDSDKDQAIFAQYSDINPGFIPFLVFGCKYVRVGAGENPDPNATEAAKAESLKNEEENLSAILCKLTDGKPTSVCEPLKEKVAEVK